tara:strand:- start:1546 stop:1827 length:282 start_codon:yes stop_codon:yes gene_type:complete
MVKKNLVHIIDYILDKTNPNHTNVWLGKVRHEHRKYKLDDVIKYCKPCNHTWSKVPEWVDKNLFRIYPEGIVPIIGKKLQNCPICKEKKNGRT